LDHSNPDVRGGSGTRCDWNVAAPILARSGYKEWILAGGLNPLNVAEAMQILHPWGVDVVSGVEEKPGRKDPAKVRAFVQAVRNTEKRR
ncbi:MAG: phosphoribosylanthranilate isomerase, partial [Candidatus Acidiferrum sp.]